MCIDIKFVFASTQIYDTCSSFLSTPCFPFCLKLFYFFLEIIEKNCSDKTKQAKEMAQNEIENLYDKYFMWLEMINLHAIL